MTGGIAFVNVSRLASDPEVQGVIDALTEQGAEFAWAWSRRPCPPSFFKTLEDVPAGMALLTIVDDSDQADALGYHSEFLGGRITGIVAVRPAGPRWSIVASHEYLETMVDPFANGYERALDGRLYPREVCDAVEGDSYEAENGTWLSNYCLPQWFNWAAQVTSGPFDRLGKVAGPFTLSRYGYADVVELTGAVTEIGAARPSYRPRTHYARCVRRALLRSLGEVTVG